MVNKDEYINYHVVSKSYTGPSQSGDERTLPGRADTDRISCREIDDWVGPSSGVAPGWSHGTPHRSSTTDRAP